MNQETALKWTSWLIRLYFACALPGVVLLLIAKQPIPIDFRLLMVFLMFLFSLLLKYKEIKVAAWAIVVLTAYDLLLRSFGLFAYFSLAKTISTLVLSGPIFWIVFDITLLVSSIFVLTGFIKKEDADRHH